MKKRKINKTKLLSRIILLLAVLFLIIFSLNRILNKDKGTNQTLSLIFNKEDITGKLSDDIYIYDDMLYMSMEDMKNIFDKNLYYEEETGKIITSSGTKVGAIDTKNNTLQLNSAVLKLDTGVAEYGEKLYIPISEITNIYNIEVTTSKNSSVVLSLYEELITVKTTKNVSLKEKPSSFSSTVQKLDEGKELIFIEDENNGWIKVLTYEGSFGYLKAKNVTEKEQKRSKTNDIDFTSKTPDIENSIEINKNTITATKIDNFDARSSVIDEIIKESISKEKFTVNINLKDVDVQKEKLERFIIEIIPRFKEIGGSIIITNNAILDEQFVEEYNLDI